MMSANPPDIFENARETDGVTSLVVQCLLCQKLMDKYKENILSIIKKTDETEF
jgi:hypothetical protein